MMTVAEWKRALNAGKLDEKLKQLYGSDAAVMAHQKNAIQRHWRNLQSCIPNGNRSAFLAPGRTEWAATTQITSTAVSLRRQSIWM